MDAGELVAVTKPVARAGRLETFFRDLPVVDLAYVRPLQELPAGLSSFDEQNKLDETFAIGEADSARGFAPSGWETFRL